jgi:hypothetical protein
VSYNTILLGDG